MRSYSDVIKIFRPFPTVHPKMQTTAQNGKRNLRTKNSAFISSQKYPQEFFALLTFQPIVMQQSRSFTSIRHCILFVNNL